MIASAAGTGDRSPAYLPDDISISCGRGGTYTARDSREWIGDAHPKFTSSLQIKGSSTTSRGADPVPYGTARISRSRFSYSFRLKPGQKLIRLHFNSIPYAKKLHDLFSVEAGHFILLGQFSASVTANALGVKSIVKEFCVSVEENEELEIVFSPESSQSTDTFAFINGIEITSVPLHLSYFGSGIKVVGQNSLAFIDNTTALEVIHRLHMKRESAGDNSRDVFGMWGAGDHWSGRTIINNNMTWNISVDVGFSYLVRLHFCEVGIKMAEIHSMNFTILLNGMVATRKDDVLKESGYDGIPRHGDHIVMFKQLKQRGTRDLSISLLFNSAFMNEYGLVKGFEIFKLSNSYNSLASPNPLLQTRDYPSRDSRSFFVVIAERNAIATIAVTSVTLVNVVIHCLRKTREVNPAEEMRKPSARAARLCRRFSLAEIRTATRDFSFGLILGRGGFGIVYKGLIDKGQETVAVKRLKHGSSQGEREFWTEIETLSELRHVNLVSLIGYCCEQREFILVYEYMQCGTLADRLYKRDMDSSKHLSWQQRLKICIGAGRGLDYLHTGYGVIHRDVKSLNILLDVNLVAKIADFGLAKLLLSDATHVSTSVKGTDVYLDPHYRRTGRLTEKSDTYAFGVVLLEVLCGRPALERSNEDNPNITSWAREMMRKGEADLLVESGLREEITPKSLKAFMEIVEGCLHEDDPRNRPTMSEVVLKLVYALEQQENPSITADAHPSKNTEALVAVNNGTLTTTSSPQVASPSKEQTSTQRVDADHPSAQKYDKKIAQTHKPSQIRPWYSIWNRITAPRRKQSADQQRSDYSTLEPRHQKYGTIYEDVNKPRRLLYSDLVAATRHFSSEYSLGFSNWRGILPDGREVSIYKEIVVDKGFQETQIQFESKLKFLFQLHHKHLVKLVGFCIKKDERFLVYEYMKNGSLYDHLHNKNNVEKSSSLINSWKIRIKISLDAARGIEYLHNYVVPPIIHRDIKPSKILLDTDWTARVCDFRLSLMCPENNSVPSPTMVAGTVGYLDPEYYRLNVVTAKSDVYSLGVVLLEILTGKKAIFKTDREGVPVVVVDYALPAIMAGELSKILDHRVGLPGTNEAEAVELVAYTAMHCVHLEGKDMPTMTDIVGNLERALVLCENSHVSMSSDRIG